MGQPPPTINLQQLAAAARAIQPWIVERRRHLHAHPELSFEETNTAAWIREQVKALGLEPAPPILPDKNGFTVDLPAPSAPGKFVLLRADFDALPIQEENDVPFKSTVPGVAHLCGHDAHTTMLLGAMKLLKERQDALPIGVRFVFQHGEEVAPGGAKDFVENGAVENVSACFGLHVSPRCASGQIGLREGPAMACVGGFTAKVRGRGGHGAMPHETLDPMPAAASAILALQHIVSRRIPPMEEGVVSVTMINGGTAFNVIPAEISFGGTFRTFNLDRVAEIERLIVETVEHAVRAYGCTAEVTADHSYPPVVNDANALAAGRAAVEGLFGADAAYPMEKNMGAEDFSYFTLARPSAFMYLGCLPNGETFYPLHSPHFLPDESVLWMGSALLAAMPFTAPGYLG